MEQERVPHLPRTPQLRIGLLVDSVTVSKYVYDFAKWANTQDGIFEITHLILHNAKASAEKLPNSTRGLISPSTNTEASGILSKTLYQLILKIEKRLLSKNERHNDHLDTFDLSRVVSKQIMIDSIIVESGSVPCFEANGIRMLKNLNLDLLIKCESSILPSDILNAARLGIISINHADNRIVRGDPAGFWEVYLRQDTTGFTIQRLREQFDGGEVLVRGHIQTSYYWLLNQAVLFTIVNYYLKSLVTKIAVAGKLPDALPSVPYSNKLFRFPTAYQAASYLLRLSALRLRKAFWRRAGITHRWHVGYTARGWRSAVLWQAQRINNPRSHFLADPFIVGKDGRNFCFVEDYDFQNPKGKIDVYELTTDGAVRIGTALEEAFHLSFPFIFEYQQELYMCPETAESRDIRIYKCAKFPLGWKLEKIVMKNISAADTMLFERDGKWWMFTNIDSAGVGNHHSELSIFYSESPFGDCWNPHALNPVIVDASRARNAGLVRDGESYFRVSQGQGFDTYGKRTVINEIVELTNSSYSERTISVITSAFVDDAVCTHHLHSNGLFTVFDFATIFRTKYWTAIFSGLIRSVGSSILRKLGLRARWPLQPRRGRL